MYSKDNRGKSPFYLNRLIPSIIVDINIDYFNASQNLMNFHVRKLEFEFRFDQKSNNVLPFVTNIRNHFPNLLIFYFCVYTRKRNHVEIDVRNLIYNPDSAFRVRISRRLSWPC